MNKVKLKKTKSSKKAGYRSPLRDEQARLTQAKIQNALLELFQSDGSFESITYKAVAQKACVTEMTVFRYFPDRSLLLKALWNKINEVFGRNITMPSSVEELIVQNKNLHLGFDENPKISVASVATPQGREMRASLNDMRRDSFLKIVSEVNPNLDEHTKLKFAGILQLLHSAYAWDSLKQQWNLSGDSIANATTEAISILINHYKKGKSL